jgi:hypothetical protein
MTAEVPKRTWMRRTVLACLLLALAGAATAWYVRPDPDFLRAQALQRSLASDEGRRLTIAEQQELRRQLVAVKLSGRQMRQLWDERHRMFMQRVDHFLALSPTERTAYMDAELDRLEALRQAEGGSGGPKGTPGQEGIPSLAERERFFKQQLDWVTPQERAKLGEYFKLLGDRRQQRGLPATGFGDGL